MRHIVLLVLFCLLTLPVFAQENPSPIVVGTNLAGVVDWTTEEPFVDVFKTARPWISQKDGANWGEGGDLALTPEGWVAQLADGQFAETLLFTADPAYPTGDYVLLYDGEGTIEFGNPNAAQIIEQSDGRLIVKVAQVEGGIFLQVRATNPDNPLRNIRFLMPDTETSYQDQPFNPLFLEKIGHFGALRFMDWMATNNSTIIMWEERPQPTDATFMMRGVPVEVMVQLANTLNVPAWFNMPHQADDDYIRQFATYVRDNLNPDLKVYIEYSNETWNSAFGQFFYVMERGDALGGGDTFLGSLRFHSERALQIFAIWEDVFGGRDRLMRVLAAQAANAWTGEQIITWKNAYEQADAIAIAPYFSCDDPANPETVDSITTLGPEELVARQLANVQAGGCAYAMIESYVELAQQYDLELVAYEGGQHLAGYAGTENNEALTDLFIAANRHPMMGEVYTTYLENWFALGGGLFMNFTDVDAPSQYGSWGLLEYLAQDGSPKYDALIAFIERSA